LSLTPKPFSFEELLARGQHRIRSADAAQSESILAHAEVALDLLTRRVTSAGIEHDLTTRELTMLEFFLRHSGRVISREQALKVLGLRP
jgi:DNA-binding response OmpR family regulator